MKKSNHERSAKPHNTHPLSVIGWNSIDCGLEWLVVPFVFVCDLGAQAVLQRRVILTSCGQLADQEERSDKCHLCFGRESHKETPDESWIHSQEKTSHSSLTDGCYDTVRL